MRLTCHVYLLTQGFSRTLNREIYESTRLDRELLVIGHTVYLRRSRGSVTNVSVRFDGVAELEIAVIWMSLRPMSDLP